MNLNDKTTPIEQEQMAEPEQIQNAHQSHQKSRRRLLKAAAVAPVIYTLPSGSALAATSSSCLGNSENIIYGVTKQTETIEVCNPGGGGARANPNACSNGEGWVTIEEETGNLVDNNNRVFTPTGIENEYHHDGKDYIYHTDQTLVAGSCWNSINLSSTKNFSDFL